MATKLTGPYQPRSIRCQGVIAVDGWSLKLYGIAFSGELPRPSLTDSIRQKAEQVLPQPPVTDSRYGVGFVCAHQGRTCDVAFVDWWEREDELHHHMFIAAPGGPLRRATADDLTACTWDLAVMGFERNAWLETVLKNHGTPRFDEYLELQLNATV